MRLASPADSSTPIPSSFGVLIVGAQTIDEIARRLGRPEIARGPLEKALQLLESANRDARRPSEELIRTEGEVRIRLEQLRAAG